ncbi:MAG TPA: restriction endonuclease subunit S [Pseudomonas xinjiangensis]|uniref:Restriction endonuclease subunit S n=2 Tax=root TaxID=1 RepID=A0A7V1BKJ9_9GAMM|nr:restriction endonuclease subunit S [Halopseudomonas xinjiangensis]HEC48318.1 restriction endonuclease subunit S [Halopseudomonas xinjiangensis]
MRSEFPTRPLAEMVVNLNRQRVPIKSSLRKAGPYPYYGAQGIVDYVDSYIFDGEFVLVAEDGENLRSRNEPVAQIATGKFWVNNHAHIIRANEISNNWFLEAAINQSPLASFVSGSTIPKLNKSNLEKIPLYCPPKPIQDQVGDFLRTIADKIANNRALATDLEAMARAIFKSWFVDFDPVKAKMEGRAPAGMDADTAALFPDELVESELGLIPKGWEVAAIADLCEIVGGATPSTKNSEYWDEGQHFWATPKDLSALSAPVLWGTSRQITDEGLAKISSGLLPEGTVLLSSRAPIGYLAITQVQTAINQGFIAMKPINGASSAFLMLWAKTFMDLIVGNANGSTFQEISKKSFRPIQLVRPPVNVLGAFSSLASPLFDTIANLDAESIRLADLRDTLLPRLISGKLRLPETETVTGQEMAE